MPNADRNARIAVVPIFLDISWSCNATLQVLQIDILLSAPWEFLILLHSDLPAIGWKLVGKPSASFSWGQRNDGPSQLDWNICCLLTRWCFLTGAAFSCGKEHDGSSMKSESRFMLSKHAGIDYKQTRQIHGIAPLRKGSWDPGRDQNGSQIGEEWKGRNPEQRKGGTKPWRTWRTQAKTKGRASWFILCWVTAMFFFWWGGLPMMIALCTE